MLLDIENLLITNNMICNLLRFHKIATQIAITLKVKVIVKVCKNEYDSSDKHYGFSFLLIYDVIIAPLMRYVKCFLKIFFDYFMAPY